MKWYYKNGDSENGPLSASALSELHSCGILKDDSPVRLDGCEDWTSYREGLGVGTDFTPATVRDVGLDASSPPGKTNTTADSARAGVPEDCPSPLQSLANCDGPPPLCTSQSGQHVGPTTPVQATAPLTAWRPRLVLFGLRYLAITIDQIILMVVMFSIAFAVLAIGVPDTFATGVLVGLFCLIGICFYFVLMESSAKRASLGKIVCGLRVSDTHGNSLTRAMAWRRTAFMLLPGVAMLIAFAMLSAEAASNLVIIAYAVNFGMSLFSVRNQTLHDRLSGTVVSRK